MEEIRALLEAWIAKYIKQEINFRTGATLSSTQLNELFNLLIVQGDDTVQTLNYAREYILSLTDEQSELHSIINSTLNTLVTDVDKIQNTIGDVSEAVDKANQAADDVLSLSETVATALIELEQALTVIATLINEAEIAISSLESPTVEVVVDTALEYILKIKDANGVIITPNLKGADGTGAGDMKASVYDPQGRAVDIFDYVDNKAGSGNAADITYDDGTVKDALDEMKTHIEDGIFCEEGVHGLRWHDNKLQFFNGEEWIAIQTGGSGVPPLKVVNPSITVGDAQLTIKWNDPEDIVIDEQTVSVWAGTKLVRKAGSYPEDEKDGVVLVDNKVRGAYASSGYVDSGLTNGTTYYYQLFPYSDTGAVNTNEANRLSATPQPYKIYGVAIDLANSNPETAVTYTDDAVGMTGGAAAWDSMNIFKYIKPCVLKNGVVQYYLNPNDFTKKADGSAADITSGNDGDVMIEIPKTGYSISTAGNTLTVKVTDEPNNPNFKYYAHSRATEGDRSKLYMGAYLGWNDGGKLRSLSGKKPTVSQTIGTFRTQAQANGAGYDLVSFYPLTLLQCLYLIKYKNLDSQTALGRGYVDGNSASINTGGANAKGMFFGETTGKQQMKLLGIEDFWGNLRWWIDGLFSDASRNILTAFQNFNDTGSGYTDRGQGTTHNDGNYMSKPQGTSQTGFISKEIKGSASTYFCDPAYLYSSRLPDFGGEWNRGALAGVFRLYVYNNASDTNSGLGARLMYL